MYSSFDSINWVTPFGVFFTAAILTAWFLARHNAKAVDVDPSHVDLLVPLTIIIGVGGGTVLAILMPVDPVFLGVVLSDGIRVRLFAVLGFGAFGVFAYSRVAHLPFWRMLDIFALPTMVALIVHRVGCFLAGCCWGEVVTHGQAIARGVQYPPGSLPYEQHLAFGWIESGAAGSLAVHPVQLYEAGLLLVLVLLLWRIPWKRRAQGSLVVITVCGYALLRFLIEYLRADSYVALGNLTATQMQCLLLMAGIVLLPRWRNSVVS